VAKEGTELSVVASTATGGAFLIWGGTDLAACAVTSPPDAFLLHHQCDLVDDTSMQGGMRQIGPIVG